MRFSIASRLASPVPGAAAPGRALRRCARSRASRGRLGPFDPAGDAGVGPFLRSRTREVRALDLATQSGPMLVIDGRLHPRFARRDTLLKTRNGVGVRADGKVIFVISQEGVSFDAFARLFRDGLKCPNALFLDGGSASSLYAPTLNHAGNIVPLGPMLAVFETNRDAPQQ